VPLLKAGFFVADYNGKALNTSVMMRALRLAVDLLASICHRGMRGQPASKDRS
jgi:hypothetical protein